ARRGAGARAADVVRHASLHGHQAVRVETKPGRLKGIRGAVVSTAPITAPEPEKNALKSASAAWTAAIIIVVLCLIATFTLRTPAASNNVASGSGSHGRGISAGGSVD